MKGHKLEGKQGGSNGRRPQDRGTRTFGIGSSASRSQITTRQDCSCVLRGRVYSRVLYAVFFSQSTVGLYITGFMGAIPFFVWLRLWGKRPPEN